MEIKKWYMASGRKSHHNSVVFREGLSPEEMDLLWQKLENIAKLPCIEVKPICTPSSSIMGLFISYMGHSVAYFITGFLLNF